MFEKEVKYRLCRVLKNKYLHASKNGGIIDTNRGMYRNSSNKGAFSHLPEKMSKKHIREIAKEYGISLGLV